MKSTHTETFGDSNICRTLAAAPACPPPPRVVGSNRCDAEIDVELCRLPHPSSTRDADQH